uniref:Uncharacterized protein n=1 Tax=Panagrolaimus sp. JU765 TaxID=591449 RepID=A0AC34R1K8_9BILA
METDRPLNGLFQEMFELGISSNSNGSFVNPLPAPPSYDSIINSSSSSTDAPPAWEPTVADDSVVQLNSTTQIFRF